jgi:hypothetical protein
MITTRFLILLCYHQSIFSIVNLYSLLHGGKQSLSVLLLPASLPSFLLRFNFSLKNINTNNDTPSVYIISDDLNLKSRRFKDRNMPIDIIIIMIWWRTTKIAAITRKKITGIIDRKADIFSGKYMEYCYFCVCLFTGLIFGIIITV